MAASKLKSPARDVLVWTGLYVLFIASPLFLVLTPPLPQGRGFWVELAVAFGFIGLAMMALQFALTARFRWIAGPFGMDAMMQFHRQAGLVAFGFILGHPIIVILADAGYLSFFDPRINLPRSAALTTVLVVLVLVITLPLWRRRLGMSYEMWRITHGMLAFLAIMIGLAHLIMVNHYSAEQWKRIVWIALVGGAMYLLVHTRLIRPIVMLHRPWRVIDVRSEQSRIWTVVLEAVNHAGMQFKPGQFVWVTFGASPFSLEQHPFTIASSALHPQRLEFTIKELGDFTSSIGQMSPGTMAYLDGPYGAFTINESSRTVVMIAGGIGITPMMSIIRTLRDRGHHRPLVLIYAVHSLDRAVYGDELQEAAAAMNLRIVYVLEQPPEPWNGERGYITRDLLQRNIATHDAAQTQCLICGPSPMMDLVEQSLLDLGVPMWNIRAERFDIV